MIQKILKLLLLISILSFISCKEEKFGIINIYTWENINIFIDNKFKVVAGENVTKIKLPEGNHIIKVASDSVDGEWHYEIEKKIYIANNVETSISLIPIQYISQQKLKIINEEKRKQLKLAKNNGCDSIKAFEEYKDYKEKILILEKKYKNIQEKRKQLKKDTSYITQNNYLDLVSFSIKANYLKIKLKNKTQNKISYFLGWFYLTDNTLKIITSLREYKEFIDIKPFSSKTFNIKLSSSSLKNESIKFLFMDLESLKYYKEKKQFTTKFNNKLGSTLIKSSNNKYDSIQKKLKQYHKKLSNLCISKVNNQF